MAMAIFFRGLDGTELTRWTNAQRNCTNTGLLCGTLIGIAHLLNLRHVHDASCAH